jgi:putative peptidoglycan lipid II flippase
MMGRTERESALRRAAHWPSTLWRWLNGHFNGVHADHKRIAKGAIWVGLFVVIGKAAAALREVAIAYRFGVSGVADAYQLAITLSTWAPMILVSVAAVVLVPLFVQLFQAQAAHRQQFAAELLGGCILLGVALAFLSLVIAPFALPLLAGGLSGETLQLAITLASGLAPLAPLILLVGIYSAEQMAREKHSNTLVEGLPPAVIATAVVLWPPNASALLWGTLVGYVFQVLWLTRLSKSLKLIPSFAFQSPYWRTVLKAAGVMTMGQLVMSLVVFADQYAAAGLGDSSIAVFGYANRVLTLLLAVGAMAVARAALPVLSDIQQLGNIAHSKLVSAKWAAFMFIVGALAAILAWLIAPPAIQLLYERGAFTPHDTAQVTLVLRYGLLQIPFYFCGLVLVQQLASRGRYGAISLVATGNFGVKVAMNLWLTPLLGIAGIALASGIMYLFAMCCFIVLAARER